MSGWASMPRSVTKMCWTLFVNAPCNALFGRALDNAPGDATSNSLGDAPGEAGGDARGGGKAAGFPEATEPPPICTITPPPPLISCQHWFLPAPFLVLPLK